MKKHLLVALISLVYLCGFSQTYNNEWILHNQSYYKIKIARDGIYQIDSATLAKSGVPIAGLNPKNFQLFQKGKELYVHIEGESDNHFNTNDYILFYAEKNTCADDSELYVNGSILTNPFTSVISDTAVVFFTWNNSTNNRRLVVENDVAFSAFTPAPYYIKDCIEAYKDEYCIGKINSTSKTSDPRYVFGEGFAAPVLEVSANNPATASKIITFNTNGIYVNGPPAQLSFVYSGASDEYYPSLVNDHEIAVEYTNQSNSWTSLLTHSFDGYTTYQKVIPIVNSTIGNSTQIKFSSVYNTAFYKGNRTYLHYMRLVYPQTFNLNNLSEEKLYIPDNTSQNKSYLNISNFNAQSGSAILMDISNHKLIATVQNGNKLEALVNNSGGIKFCYLAAGSALKKITSMSKVNGTGTFVDYKIMAMDSAYIIITHPLLQSGAAQYAAYRASSSGGGHHILTAFIPDLYDQFAYGVVGNPLSIKNFVRYVIDNFPSLPQNLFLIGKSVHIVDCLKNPVYQQKRLLPSFGYPSSDILLTQGILNKNSLAPSVATGRLAAQNNADIQNYLDKVKNYESTTIEDWQKKVLHFVGGTNASDQNLFNQYMSVFKNIIEDSLVGGVVSTFKKTSTAPIGINTNDSIKNMIEDGVSLITFFGHGSTVGFEQNIDDPFAYNNSPRFPMLVANSCYTGDIHTGNVFSNSEKFTLAKDHGTIGFLATVSSGVTFSLARYSEQFYKNICYRAYGQSYGEAIKKGVDDTYNYDPSDTTTQITTLEMTLHGDPACKPFSPKYPDYKIDNADVSFDIKTLPDSITLNINIHNIGKTVKDSFIVYVERTLPNLSTKVYLKKFKAPYNTATLSFNIEKDQVNGIGLNKFFVHVDRFNKITELNENNNSTNGNLVLFIPGGDVIPVFPYKYSIVPDSVTIVLKASTANPFAPAVNYVIQVDTNDAFSNPLVNTVVNAPGGVISLKINLLAKDSLVYFWRIAKDSSNPAAINWRESSFQTIKRKRGWAQAHFNQFKNNTYQFVKYSGLQRQFQFVNDVKSVFCKTAYVSAPYNVMSFAENGYYLNNAQMVYWTCGGGNGWTFAVIDSISGEPELADTVSHAPAAGTWLSQYNSCACVPDLRPAFDFGVNDYCADAIDWRQRVEQFLNAIPVGKKVLAYSHDNDGATNFPASLRTAFQTIGSASIQAKPDTCQMIIFGTKRASPHTGAHEVIGKTIREIVTLNDSVKTNWTNGYIASEIIGPSTKWRSLHWSYTSLETPSKDSIYIKLLGIKLNGAVDTLGVITKDSLNVMNLSHYIQANAYPYLKLMAIERDDIKHTPPQLQRWQVIFDELPEAAVHPPAGFAVSSASVQEGDKILFKIPIKNISSTAFTDSLLVNYWIEGNNAVSHTLPYHLKKTPFLPDSLMVDSLYLNTFGYAGNNALWVEVNPINKAHSQLEQHHFNNYLRIPFRVNKDNVNPLLDITFDGVHILNGDIISSKPSILITLKDENKYLALNDTNDFAIYLKAPGGIQEERVHFSQVLSFIPAQLPNNSCKISYKPLFQRDGKYELTVQAKDRSSNESGATNYKIQFEVLNRSSITEVLNYPNPFSNSTRFVFTLTGSEIPETFKIQIMTISGKVVREIHRNQLGNIHIGRNITEYAWDGKDDFGDQLGNGVYLYRIISRINGVEIEHKASAADEYIKNGWGKMVLMR